MRLHRALEFKSAVLVYGFMGLFALIYEWIVTGTWFYSWTLPESTSAFAWMLAVAIFCSFLCAYFVSTRLLESGHELRKALQQILTPISYLQIVVLSFVGGIVEEWFFRGVLSLQFGVILSSVVFGLAHLVPSRGTIQWGILMTLLGTALGLLFARTHSLALVAAVHVAINFVVLFRLNHSAHQRATNALNKF